MSETPEGIASPPPSNWRHNLFVLQVLVIVFPMTVVAALFGASLLWSGFSSGPQDVAASMLVVAALIVPFACGWKLCIAYAARGPAALVTLHQAWWYGAGIGALVPLVGLVALVLRLVFGDFPVEPVDPDPAAQPFGPTRIGTIALATFAAPLLLPLAHVWMERRRAAGGA